MNLNGSSHRSERQLDKIAVQPFAGAFTERSTTACCLSFVAFQARPIVSRRKSRLWIGSLPELHVARFIGGSHTNRSILLEPGLNFGARAGPPREEAADSVRRRPAHECSVRDVTEVFLAGENRSRTCEESSNEELIARNLTRYFGSCTGPGYSYGSTSFRSVCNAGVAYPAQDPIPSNPSPQAPLPETRSGGQNWLELSRSTPWQMATTLGSTAAVVQVVIHALRSCHDELVDREASPSATCKTP